MLMNVYLSLVKMEVHVTTTSVLIPVYVLQVGKVQLVKLVRLKL